jgi:hypothetical protein
MRFARRGLVPARRREIAPNVIALARDPLARDPGSHKGCPYFTYL